ncbi:MAG TPA: T9SS type A sorting domain-containing protein [Chitinophagaceae bacterium]|nr:T9SS type A sorting domain-containing protein [Chitinophagaceae bacterium]
MFKKLLSFFVLFVPFIAFAQSPGDTITVQTFTYGSTTRDTMINFPNLPGINYEKVIMLYNMRCKNGLVSPGVAGQTNIGCGEWDYSCNTYLTDSSRVDSVSSNRPSHTISNFTGGSYPYVTSPYYNQYQFAQTVTNATIVSENQYPVGSGILSLNNVLPANKKSGRAQILFTQAELAAAGVTAGNIDGFIFNALSASTVNFLKVRIKNTTLTSLDASLPDLTGYSEHYYSNTNFTIGNNRLQFHTPFLWNGSTNIIIDLSFTNSTTNSVLNLAGGTTSNISMLSATNGYHINTASGIVGALPTAPFSSINNQITVSFWSKGNSGVNARTTSILEGVDNANRRQLNIHHPWSNSRVYFDCGNNGSGYDRIDKLANLSEIEQTWNHWTFTKNATTGIMNIYLNGTLWHTGTGKVNPITIDSLILGANINKGNLYHGDIDELTIWNAELNQTDIQAWMNKSILPSHPNYSNLVAYYKLDEGSGALSADASVNALSGNFTYSPDWKFTRGDELSRLFVENTQRPNTIFLQGNYVITNSNINILDSLPASPNIVNQYTVVSNGGTLLSDSYNITSTNIYWHASFKYLYDGVTGAKIDSFVVAPSATISISNLPYMERYPSKFELMSFVTPYGINLDLGMSGKTWTFDMTDFLPILKGSKRLSIERGGEWQENLDIKFYFLVGTPVREVKDIKQIWRQPVNCNYDNIYTNKYFEPRDVLLDASGKSFKIRTMITGHGQEGEFIERDHTMNIAGGLEEFTWKVYKKCGLNPVFPQGGTWVYDRCGWCPGMASDLEEFDITPYVTAGQFANIDYHMAFINPADVGNSNYIVTNQLVTYGPLNFNLDAAVVDIMAPTKKIEYARDQAICANPKIIIQNTGSTPLTSLTIEYWINNNTQRSTYNWMGNLAPLAKAEVELSNSSLWVNLISADNEFHVELKNPNGGIDQYSFNNKMNSSFVITDVVPANFIVYHRSNAAGAETSYKLMDEAGNVLLTRSGLANNTIYRDTFNLTFGCYKFEVIDSDNDGISWWANSDGAGIMRFQRGNGTTLKTFNPDFGAGFTYNFTIDYPLTFDDLTEMNEVKIYPNPANNQFTVEGVGIEDASIVLNNSLGQKLIVPFTKQPNKVNFDTRQIASGIYFVSITREGKTSTRKLVIE